MKNQILKNAKGMSLTEIMVAMGIIGFVTLMISTTFTDIFRWQGQITSRDEANDFYTAAGRMMFTDQTCTEALKNQAFKPKGEVSITLPGFWGTAATARMKAGTEIDPIGTIAAVTKGGKKNATMRIKSIMMQDKGMTAQDVSVDGNAYKRYLAAITLQLETKGGPKNSMWNEIPPRTFEIPVLVDAANKVQRCYVEMKTSDACQLFGGKMDVSTGHCTPTTECVFDGYYSVNYCTINKALNCDPLDPGCKGDTVASCPKGTPNPNTKTMGCSAGVSAKLTGTHSFDYSETCGKKCTQTVNVTAAYYVCLRCG